eukprot:CAMPEP_0117658736 /NCGR_PEP_ID=MMETSP0804-20121206/6024_1 /TAXON_ID=1074897 /ORGANISM="Tetraselmis astigmatica, Strain CCMP880" /LENGTH=146 /DNA_ID=CAMNT_0005465279 /DNA_START=271 /DNA_END=711 /DNA_ORIENTATION=+
MEPCSPRFCNEGYVWWPLKAAPWRGCSSGEFQAYCSTGLPVPLHHPSRRIAGADDETDSPPLVPSQNRPPATWVLDLGQCRDQLHMPRLRPCGTDVSHRPPGWPARPWQLRCKPTAPSEHQSGHQAQAAQAWKKNLRSESAAMLGQ